MASSHGLEMTENQKSVPQWRLAGLFLPLFNILLVEYSPGNGYFLFPKGQRDFFADVPAGSGDQGRLPF